MAGLSIIANSDDRICTAGFLARRVDTNPDKMVVVTAGHCVKFSGGAGTVWELGDDTQTGDPLGTGTDSWIWADNADTDIGYIVIDPDNYPEVFNKLMYNDAYDIGNITSKKPGKNPNTSGHQSNGDQVCRYGWGSWDWNTSPKDCGQIDYANISADSCVGTNCKWINHMNVVSFDSHGGDSGGPVYVPVGSDGVTTLYGTHVHSDADYPAPPPPDGRKGWYTPWDWAVDELLEVKGVDLNVCITSNC